jgi:hypothetical protein
MGAPDIGNFFNTNGIIQFEGELNFDKLTPKLYDSMKEAINDNYKRSLQYAILEDWIYENYFEKT